MNKKIIIVIAVLVVVLIGYGIMQQPSEKDENEANKDKPQDLFAFNETEYDFGIIKQSGGKVSHQFQFQYTGNSPVKITGLPTSCACTSATISKTELAPGDEAVLTVSFNPNLHEEPEGRFFKSVSILSDPSIEEIPEVKIWAQIDLDLGPGAYELKADHDEDEEEEEEGLTSYHSITPEVLAGMLDNKDFILIDVHIPEQEHIIGTDEVIPYNEIEENFDRLPDNKNAKIVLYCRSGAMSRAAAYLLVEHGYTNIYDLNGGKEAFDEYMASKIH